MPARMPTRFFTPSCDRSPTHPLNAPVCPLASPLRFNLCPPLISREELFTELMSEREDVALKRTQCQEVGRAGGRRRGQPPPS